MQIMERRCDTRASVSLMGRVQVDESESPALLLDLSGSARLQLILRPIRRMRTGCT